jgi:hypothetical protein
VVLLREKEGFFLLLWGEDEQPQPKRKLKLVDFGAEKSMQQKGLNWGTVVIDCPIPCTLFPTIISQCLLVGF